MGIVDFIGFLVYGVGIRGIIFWILTGFIILNFPCNFSRYFLWLIFSLWLALKPISRFFVYIRTGKHKISLQMNTFSSFPIIIGNPINRSLNLIYKDFVNSAFPEIMKTAKEGDEIIVKTHLIPHKFIKKLPGNPKIKEIKASMLTIIINISLAAISFIIRKYVYKLNKGNLLEYLRKLNKHRYYVVIWKKVKK